MSLNIDFMVESLPQILASIPMTLLIVAMAAPVGWVLGLLIALVRNARVPVLSQILAVFISFMRSVPIIVVLFVAYFSVPLLIQGYCTSIGLSVDVNAVPAVAYAAVAFALDQAAYSSEAFRSAILSVDRGQLEAAESVGMTGVQAYLRVVLPQAFVTALPNLNGLFVGLVQSTSLAYYVGVYEITATSTLLANSSYSYIEAYLLATVIYEVLSFVINRVFRVIERRVSRFRDRSAGVGSGEGAAADATAAADAAAVPETTAAAA